MRVIKNRQIENIDWELSDQFRTTGNLIFPFEIYTEGRDALLSREGKTGLIINGDTPIENIHQDLDKFALIGLEFTNYADGRCFSHACLLRDAYQYQGDILAIGDILRDQLAHLERCGVNLIKLSGQRDLEDALQAYSEFTIAYQPAIDKLKTIPQLR